jgi:SSS family solute:Na+ symporter
MRAGFLVLFLAYLLALVAVGLVFSRRMKGLEDFFLASRQISAALLFFTVCAAWIGASSVLVTTDQALQSGVSAFWLIGLPAVLTTLIFALFLAGPIFRLPALTLADLAEARYGRLVRHIVSLLIVWYMVLLASSQMVAIGSFLQIFLGRSYLFCLAAGTAVVLAYSVLGGFFTVAITDRFHFFFLISGLLVLFFWLLGFSPPAAVMGLAVRLGKQGYGNFFLGWKENSLIVLSFVLAWLISPIVWQRIQAARSSRAARRGLLAASAAFLVAYGIIVSIGMLFLPFYGRTRLEHPLLAEAITGRAGPILGGLIFVGVAAAIMSTMDTAINTGAFTLSRDVVQRFLPGSAGSRQVLVSRLATLLVGALAFLVATRFESILKTLGLASEIMAEGLFVPGLAMLYVKKRMPLAGLLSLILGGGFSFLSFASASRLIPLGLPAWPYSVPWGVGLSLAGYLAGVAFYLTLRARCRS